jgi:hypothetical protein
MSHIVVSFLFIVIAYHIYKRHLCCGADVCILLCRGWV